MEFALAEAGQLASPQCPRDAVPGSPRDRTALALTVVEAAISE